jgi:hypothetical protein
LFGVGGFVGDDVDAGHGISPLRLSGLGCRCVVDGRHFAKDDFKQEYPYNAIDCSG